MKGQAVSDIWVQMAPICERVMVVGREESGDVLKITSRDA